MVWSKSSLQNLTLHQQAIDIVSTLQHSVGNEHAELWAYVQSMEGGIKKEMGDQFSFLKTIGGQAG